MEFLTTNISLIGFAVTICLLLVVIYKRAGGAPSEHFDQQGLEVLNTKLSDAEQTSARASALAEERKSEIERLNQDLSKLRSKIEDQNEKSRTQSNELTKVTANRAAEQKASQEKIEMLSQVRDEMTAKFKELAGEALTAQGESFSKANIEKLEATLTPLKEHVGHFEKELRQVHEETVKDRERLKAEIAQLSKRSEAISQEAVSLTKALKGDTQMQGAWGEMILETILEGSGLREGEEYETQAHRTGAEGERLRPDVVVKIPGGKTLVVDSKVSLVAYNDAVNSDTDGELIAARKRHLVSIKSHINSLSAKGYQTAEESTVDYVILFIPIEGALSEALREDPTLTSNALEKNITIATPTTLMMALKTIASVWAVEKRNKNAELIADRAGKLYDKVSSFVQSMEKVGERLGSAQDSYDQAFNQLSKGRGNVISQVQTLKALGAKTTKQIMTDHDDEDLIQLEDPDR